MSSDTSLKNICRNRILGMIRKVKSAGKYVALVCDSYILEKYYIPVRAVRFIIAGLSVTKIGILATPGHR